MIRRRSRNPQEIEVQPANAERTPMLHSVTRFWLSLMLIGIVLYAALLAIGHTAGFRNLIEQKAESLASLKVKIEKAHIGFDLQVRIKGLRGFEVGATNIPSLEVGVLSIVPSVTGLMREEPWPFQQLAAADVVIRFQSGPAGWVPLPALANAIAPWMNVPVGTNELAPPDDKIAEYLRNQGARIRLENARIMYADPQQSEIPQALAEGVSIEVASVQPLDERILWAKMQAGSLQNNGAEWMRGLELEWIRQRDQDVILRINKATSQGATDQYPPAPLAAPER